MSAIEIQLTKDDIAKGHIDSQTLCPLALAVKRKFPGKDVWVNSDRIRIGLAIYKAEGLRAFVEWFDKDEGPSFPKLFRLFRRKTKITTIKFCPWCLEGTPLDGDCAHDEARLENHEKIPTSEISCDGLTFSSGSPLCDRCRADACNVDEWMPR